MDGFGADIDGPLIAVRAVHFAATAITAGTLVFRTVVTNPASPAEPAVAQSFRTQTQRVAWIGLATAMISGVIWLLLQASSMSGLPFDEAMTSRVLSTVLSQTQFGQVSEIRMAMAVILAACLAFRRTPLTDWLALALALGLTAAIAWTGHAGSTLGELGNLHLAADVLHLSAAAGWIGGLVSLVVLLAAARRHPATAWAQLARDATRRFSILGIASVATLLLTGIVNAWILVGSFHALTATGYGRLLMFKVAAFAAMVAFAAVNRFWLTPELDSAGGLPGDVLHRLTRNSTIEIVLGLLIFAIVGMLGTLHPAIHLVPG